MLSGLKDKKLENIRLIELFTQSPISIEIYNNEGILLDVNQACVDLFGLVNSDDIKGFNLFTNPHLTPEGLFSIKSGNPIRYEVEYDFDFINEKNIYRTSHRGKCYLECFIKPTFDLSNSISGYIVYITDITERKKAEIILAKQARELQDANATKDKFMSIIAHDLKSPFNAIMGFSDLMVKNFDQMDSETILKGLKIIDEASNHAHKLLDNLLLWARNQAKQNKYAPEVINVKKQIKESVKEVESIAKNKEILIVTQRIDPKIQVFADKNMLDTIIRNLLTNAIKFSFKGNRIKIAASQTGANVLFTISDNGIGIQEKRLKELFQIDKYTNTNGTENELGTGLGLLLCKDFVEKNNGTIWIESIPNKGTQAFFTIPSNAPLSH